LKNKHFYLYGANEIETKEINICFEKLETFVEAYNTMNLLSSYVEELKNFIQRLYVHPQIKNARGYLNKVRNIIITVINQLINIE